MGLTPFETGLIVEERTRAAIQSDLRAGWFSANYARHKKMPELKKEIEQLGPKKPDTVLSGQAAIDFVKAMTIAQGGTVGEGI